ncbi:MAG: hypothetical protein ACOCQD_00950 [archaeon]
MTNQSKLGEKNSIWMSWIEEDPKEFCTRYIDKDYMPNEAVREYITEKVKNDSSIKIIPSILTLDHIIKVAKFYFNFVNVKMELKDLNNNVVDIKVFNIVGVFNLENKIREFITKHENQNLDYRICLSILDRYTEYTLNDIFYPIDPHDMGITFEIRNMIDKVIDRDKFLNYDNLKLKFLEDWDEYEHWMEYIGYSPIEFWTGMKYELMDEKLFYEFFNLHLTDLGIRYHITSLIKEDVIKVVIPNRNIIANLINILNDYIDLDISIKVYEKFNENNVLLDRNIYDLGVENIERRARDCIINLNIPDDELSNYWMNIRYLNQNVTRPLECAIWRNQSSGKIMSSILELQK